MLRAIKTEKQYRTALKRLDRLMDAAPASREVAELEVLAILVEKYERERFPIAPPAPIDVIRFRMEQMQSLRLCRTVTPRRRSMRS